MIRMRTLLAVLMLGALFLAACNGVDAPAGDDDTDSGTDTTQDDPSPTDGDGDAEVSVALLVNGELGDESFFDSANRGVTQAGEELGVDVRVIETGYEAANWEPGLRSAAQSGEYDLIITGTFPMAEHLAAVAEDFPDQQFVFYDAVLEADNVYSVTYAQNEGSFLAGAFAALVTTSDELEGANPDDARIGFVGGIDLPVIRDFLVGYEQGAQHVDPDVEVLSSFAGDFGDPGRGLELATAQFNQGADIVFQVAGGTGTGVINAAEEQGRYAIGVDSNQNPLAPGTVLTSMMKNVDVSLYRAIELFVNGELPFGEAEALGIAEGGVGLAQDDLYAEHVPQSIRDRMDEIMDELESGAIDVDTVFE